MVTNPPVHWFFIRGLMREASHWENFPSLFEKAFPNTKVITLDLPGTGKQWRSTCPPSVEKMVEAVRNEAQIFFDSSLRKYGNLPPCYLLAISLGGMVALEWLKRFPNDCLGAVLINTSLGGISPFYQRLKPQAWLPLFDIILTKDIRYRERKVLSLTTSHFQVNETVLAKRVEAFETQPASKVTFFRQLIAASRFRYKPNTSLPPLLFLNSLGDKLVDARCSQKIQSKWGGSLKTHPSANHDLPLEDPEWVISQIRQWLISTTTRD